MAEPKNHHPLDYQSRPEPASMRGPWWKFRRSGEGRLFVVVVIVLGAVAMIDAVYVEYLQTRRRALPPPTPAASRPTINIHLPPT
jgi:hypothetical protein